MRRDIKIQFYVNREEADELKRKANSAGMSQARLIRMLLDGYNPPPAPDEKFFEAMNLLTKMYERVVGLSLSCSDGEKAKFIADEAKGWAVFQKYMQQRYLLPERKSVIWQ